MEPMPLHMLGEYATLTYSTSLTLFNILFSDKVWGSERSWPGCLGTGRDKGWVVTQVDTAGLSRVSHGRALWFPCHVVHPCLPC